MTHRNGDALHDSGAPTTAVAKWVAATDLPLLVLALASIPLLVLEGQADAAVADSALYANFVIWGLFAVDLGVRTWLVKTNRWRYLMSCWFDVAIVVLAVIPFLRPLRVFRSARALRAVRSLRVVGFLGRFWASSTRIWHGFHGRVVGIGVMVVLIAGSVGVWTVERHADGPIDSYADALWWSMATITTVGYGDMYPTTPEGRGIATFIMLAGIAIFGVVAANLASLFIRQPEQNDHQELLDRLDVLAAEIAELKASPADRAAGTPQHNV